MEPILKTDTGLFSRKAMRFVLIIILLVAVYVIGGFAFNQESEVAVRGPYTFDQTITEKDGTVAEVFASGDQYYNYLHDKDGFILVKNDGYLYYAQEKQGRPVASNVRWNASPVRILALQKMGYDDIDFAANTDLLTTYETTETDNQPLLSAPNSAAGTPRNVYNLVIYIRFTDSAVYDNEALDATNTLSIHSNDDSEVRSIRSFFKKMSGDTLFINNYFGYSDAAKTVYYIYTASGTQSSYQVNQVDSSRRAKESELLSGAMAGFSSAYRSSDIAGSAFDLDGNGRFDSISFIVLGKSSTIHGSLLWPHQWDCASVGISTSITVGNGANQRVLLGGSYSFSFAVPNNSYEYTYAVACHEMGHVFGAPDYYSYESSSYRAVGLTDLMGNTSSIVYSPPYMLTYTRNRWLEDYMGRTDTVTSAGSYTLKATTEATSDSELVAIKIPTTTSGVYLMAEYRIKTSTSGYDNNLTASGVVVYRVNENISGNTEATASSQFDRHELYVYRTGTTEATMFLNAGNPSMSGFSIASGVNLAVTITVVSLNLDNTATISVTGAALPGHVTVDNDYFLDKISFGSATYTSDVEQLKFGVNATLNFSNVDMTKLTSVTVRLLAADGTETHSMTASAAGLASHGGAGTHPATMFFNYYGGGESSSGYFSGQREGMATPKYFAAYVTDTDGDVITLPLGLQDRVAIDDDELIWENIAAQAGYYGVTIIEASQPYIEVLEGEEFSLSYFVRPNSNINIDLNVNYDFTVFTFNSANLLSANPGSVRTEPYLFTFSYGTGTQTITSVAKVKVVASKTTPISVAITGSNVYVLGLEWNEQTTARVNLGGSIVYLKNTTPLNYSPYGDDNEILFEYNGVRYSTTISRSARLSLVTMTTAKVINLYPGEYLPSNLSVKLNFIGTSTTNEFTLAQLASYGITYSPDYNPATAIPNAYNKVKVNIRHSGVSVNTYFYVYLYSYVSDSATLTGEGTVVENGVTYGQGVKTSSTEINWGGLKLNYQMRTSPSTTTEINGVYSATPIGDYYFTIELNGYSDEPGDYSGTVKFYNKTRTGYLLMGTITANFRVLNNITSVTIVEVSTGKTRTVGDTIYFYYEDLIDGSVQFACDVTYSDSTTERHAFALDRTHFSTFDRAVSLQISFLPSQEQKYYALNTVTTIAGMPEEVYYGETLPTSFNLTYADSSVGTGEVTLTAFNNKGQIGAMQTVTASITYDTTFNANVPYEKTVEQSFSVRLKDGVYRLENVSMVQSFRYGKVLTSTDIDALTYLSYKNYYDGNTTDYTTVAPSDYSGISITPLNFALLTGSTRSAEQAVTIGYGGKTKSVTVTLNNDIKSVNIENESYQYRLFNDNSAFNMRVTYDNAYVHEFNIAVASENIRVVGANDSLSPFLTSSLGEYSVRIFNPYVAGEMLSNSVKITVYDTYDSIIGVFKPDGTATETFALNYGEALSLSGYKLKYRKGSTDNILTLKEEHYAFTLEGYSTHTQLTALGLNISVLKKGTVSATASVAVNIKAEVLKEIIDKNVDSEVAPFVTVDYELNRIYLTKALKVSELKAALKTTATRFTLSTTTARADADFAGGYDRVGTVTTYFAVVVQNTDGYAVKSFGVYLKGDATGDGQITDEDIELYADVLLDGGTDYIDASGSEGGSFNLDDFVKRMLERKAQTEEPSPIALSETFVSDGIKKRRATV